MATVQIEPETRDQIQELKFKLQGETLSKLSLDRVIHALYLMGLERIPELTEIIKSETLKKS